jgi:tetratricopeptide (TPR) repeat protein
MVFRMMKQVVRSILAPYFKPLTRLCLTVNVIFLPTLQSVDAKDLMESSPDSIENTASGSYKSDKETLIYQYLLGDIAGRRGKLEMACEAMAQAARISGDKETTTRAYSFAIAAGRTDIALEMAEQMLALKTDVSQARVMLLRAYIAADRPDDVYDVLVILLDQSGGSADVVIRYVAEAFGSVQDPGRWLGVMDRLVEYLPDSPEVHLAHGFVSHRSGRQDQADSSLALALQLRPGWEEAAIFRLSWWNDGGNRKEIRVFSEEFLGAYPDRGRFQLVFARLLLQWNDSGGALQQFLTLIQREPTNSDAIFSAGVLYLQGKQYRLAAEMLQRYIELVPDSDQARLYLARIAREEGRYESAMEWLSRIYGEKFYLEAQLEKSKILSDKGRLDEALTQLAQIVPHTAAEQVKIYLAEEQLLREAGKIDQALALLNAALIEIPDDLDLLYARGLVTAQLKLLVDHERDMRRLIELQPDNAHAYNALGYTLADESSRLDEALALINKAIELSPDDPFILDSLGWVHYRLGDYTLAVNSLRKAFDIRSDPEIAAHLGEVLWIQGRVEEAHSVWEMGLKSENGVNNPVLNETIRRLAQ